MITHLEPDILECEIKWALGSITMPLITASLAHPFLPHAVPCRKPDSGGLALALGEPGLLATHWRVFLLGQQHLMTAFFMMECILSDALIP